MSFVKIMIIFTKKFKAFFGEMLDFNSWRVVNKQLIINLL